MDFEFHYHITYYLALKAGFSPEDAFKLAYSSQYVDDNASMVIVRANGEKYKGEISQTMDITKPDKELDKVYPAFHFVPGESNAPGAQRQDGKTDGLNTTPDSPNANLLMKEALQSKNLYRIGIAAHAYVDTWAHQNFLGVESGLNGLKGFPEELLPNVGHADAFHQPDIANLEWKDPRLAGARQQVDNKARFLEAAGRLFDHFWDYTGNPPAKKAAAKKEAIEKVSGAIGETTSVEVGQKARLMRYREILREALGSDPPEYDELDWLLKAVKGPFLKWLVKVKRPVKFGYAAAWAIEMMGRNNWIACRDQAGFQATDWYRFQEAVKGHQKTALEKVKVDGVPLREKLGLA